VPAAAAQPRQPTDASAAAVTPSAVSPARLPTNGWIALAKWSASAGLGQPHRIAMETYAVATPRGKAVFQPGSQCVRWEGVNVWLGFAPRYLEGQPHLHALDVQRTLGPLVGGPRPLAPRSRVVVLDPGHGGADGGTQGARDQLEKNFALDWALRTAALLRQKGWEVHLTRTNDLDLTLPERIVAADRLCASLFVSLHFNGLAADARHSGIETFCTTPVGLPSSVKRNGEDLLAVEHPNNRFDAENLRLAYRIHRELLSATQALDGGVRRARFISVIRAQGRPAVLVEGGFLSNPAEARRVATPAYRQKLAEALARAIE